jgi:5'-nucleotidase
MRTFLVVPELKREVTHWEQTKGYYVRLQNLETLLREYGFEHSLLYATCSLCVRFVVCFYGYYIYPLYRDSVPGNMPKVIDIQQAIKSTSRGMEEDRPGTLGSLFRCGPRQTFFAYQATRFADLYAASCTSLLHCSMDFHFIAPHSLMPHETMLLSSGMGKGHTPIPFTDPPSSRHALTPPDFTDDEEDGAFSD